MPKKKVMEETLKLLAMQSRLPLNFEGAGLYGKIAEEQCAKNSVYKVYKLSNETGTGKVTVYNVFTGIELYYNDMHLSYCNREQETVQNVVEINHCAVGRYECSFGDNGCCYMSAGDLSIGSAMRKKSFSCFPLDHYHGITILINIDELLPQVREIMKILSIDLEHIKQYICTENRCCIMRANPSIDHIFSELYHVREQRKSGYMKVKILELLLFLSDLDTREEVLQTSYLSLRQVGCAKKVASVITEDLTRHITIQDLAKMVELSPTALKNCFHVVYGTSIYAYLRVYRLQTAQKMLLQTEYSVAEIAHRIGYENPNKFTTAFKDVYGITPTEFRKSVHLDRCRLFGDCSK